MSDTRIILGIVAFYVSMYYLLAGVGVVTLDSPWQVPTFPGQAAENETVVAEPQGFFYEVLACTGGILDTLTLGLFGGVVNGLDSSVPLNCSLINSIPILSDISGFFRTAGDTAAAIINGIIGMLNFVLAFTLFLKQIATFDLVGVDPLFTVLLLMPALAAIVMVIVKTARGSGG